MKPDWGVGRESGWVRVGLPGGASLPFEFVAGERPEVVEEESPPFKGGAAGVSLRRVSCREDTVRYNERCPLPPPFEGGIRFLPAGTVMNGRISRPGEVDRYRLGDPRPALEL